VTGRPRAPHDGGSSERRQPDDGGFSAPRRRTPANVAEAENAVAEVARAGRSGTNSSRSSGDLAGPSSEANEFRADFPRGSDFVDSVDGYSEWAAEAYRRIRDSPDDTAFVAANTGIDPRIVEGMRQNLFVQEHDIPLGPNHVERGFFTPDDDVANLWDNAARGTLSPQKAAEFRNLAAHEYVENKLMEAGLPYRSSHPNSFDADGDRILHPDHPGAHDLAPNEWRPDAPLRHWEKFGLNSSGLQMADDLSNLDDIVDTVLRGLGR
jgi:hypothetical protein